MTTIVYRIICKATACIQFVSLILCIPKRETIGSSDLRKLFTTHSTATVNVLGGYMLVDTVLCCNYLYSVDHLLDIDG